jgi:hypothetical protein
MSDKDEIEELLRRYSLKPPPPQLKERVIRAARQERLSRRLISPAFAVIGVVCLILAGFSLIFDWQISRYQQRRLASLFNLPQASPVYLGNENKNITSDQEGEFLGTEITSALRLHHRLTARKNERSGPGKYSQVLKEEYLEN